jgi:hypothetical protein
MSWDRFRLKRTLQLKTPKNAYKKEHNRTCQSQSASTGEELVMFENVLPLLLTESD